MNIDALDLGAEAALVTNATDHGLAAEGDEGVPQVAHPPLLEITGMCVILADC